ncbi:glycosyltransferase [candidate division KSB1 bacterium]|nr:glycosyltransferase [candidate division KSB1 bacterium]
MITIFKFVLLIFVLAYIGQIVFLLYGTRFRKPFSRNTDEPTVAVVITACNEAEHLPACLDSLHHLNYPVEKLQLILINDGSDDATPQLLQAFVQAHAHARYLAIERNQSLLTNRANALATGIACSDSELIVLTDADCIVPPDWIHEHVAEYSPRTGLVAGITTIRTAVTGGSILEKIQALDWIYLLSIGTSAAQNQVPLSCVGNNVSFRRQVYEEIGGYTRIGFSVTEDSAFLNAILQQTQWQVKFSFQQKLVVTSHPVARLTELFYQRQRWATGSLAVRFFGKLLILIGGSIHILIPLALAIPNLRLPGLIGLGIVVAADFGYLFRVTNLLEQTRLLKYFLGFEGYYFVYTTILALVTLGRRKIRWKGRVYDWRNGQRWDDAGHGD